MLCFWHTVYLALDKRHKSTVSNTILCALKYWLFRTAKRCCSETLHKYEMNRIRKWLQSCCPTKLDSKHLVELLDTMDTIEGKKQYLFRSMFPRVRNMDYTTTCGVESENSAHKFIGCEILNFMFHHFS